MLEAVGVVPPPASECLAPVGAAAQAILERLRDGPSTADELVRAAGLDPAQASAALVELELAGRVALDEGAYRVSV